MRCRDAAPSLDLPAVFQNSRDHGLEPASLNQIAREWAPRLDIGESDVRSYLTQNIHYQLDAECLEGLQLFYRYAAEIGACLPRLPCGLSKPQRPSSPKRCPHGHVTGYRVNLLRADVAKRCSGVLSEQRSNWC